MGRRVPGPDSKPYGYVTVRASTLVKNRCGDKWWTIMRSTTTLSVVALVFLTALSSPSRFGLMSGVDYWPPCTWPSVSSAGSRRTPPSWRPAKATHASKVSSYKHQLSHLQVTYTEKTHTRQKSFKLVMSSKLTDREVVVMPRLRFTFVSLQVFLSPLLN